MSCESVKDVLRYWSIHDVRYLPGVTDDELIAFEARWGVTLPHDMRCFYGTTNGTRVPLFGQDHDSYDFWRLADVAPDSEFDWAMNFADYREMSWWYAVDLSGRGGHERGSVYFMGARGGLPLIIASSFAEFLNLYVSGNRRLWPVGALAYHKSVVDRC